MNLELLILCICEVNRFKTQDALRHHSIFFLMRLNKHLIGQNCCLLGRFYSSNI